MREIKFRAWAKKARIMITPFYSINSRGEWGIDAKYNLIGELAEDKTIMFPKGGIEIMQFTGMTDSENKDIYEGDIIQYQTTSGYDSSDTYEEIAEVIYKNGAFCPIYLAERELHNFDDESLIVENIKIIGNIYENPELFKSEE